MTSEKWEYQIVAVNAQRWTGTGLPGEINQKFDEYGAKGWELVSTESIIRPAWLFGGSKTVEVIAYFKRRL